MTEPHPYDAEVIDLLTACTSTRNDADFKDMLTGLSRQNLKLCIEALQRPRTDIAENRHVLFATVRDGEAEDHCGRVYRELHIETRFSDGEKYAAIKVDASEEALAQFIANVIRGESAIKNEVVDD